MANSILPIDLAWRLRADLRHGAPACSPISEWFGFWWITEGHREYPHWFSAVDLRSQSLQSLLLPLPDWPSHGQFGMSALLRYLLENRADLRAAFDVSTERGLWHAIAWLFTHGLREYRLMEAVDAETLKALDAPPALFELSGGDEPNDKNKPALTWLMFFVWRCDANLQATFDLRTSRGRSDYLSWFFFDGVPALHLVPLIHRRWRNWLLHPQTHPTFAGVTVPRAAVLMWRRRHDLQQAFDLRSPAGWAGLAQWSEQARQVEPGMCWLAAEGDANSALATLAPTQPRRFGLNLIGFAFGELGIGEDVRMAASACEAAGIPFTVVNIHPGVQSRQADQALAAHVIGEDAEAPYSMNLFCLTGFDTARVYLERGAALFDGRCNIGWWPWELPVWPKDWNLAFNLVNEVWAATEFTQTMYADAQMRAVSPAPTFVPVTLMPLPASVSRVKQMPRRALGLPGRRFLFLYVFDFNSYLVRKNPFATLRAFRRAFAAGDDSVGLVLKTMNCNPGNPEWLRFLRECAKDSRIVVLDKTLDRGEVLGLIQSCDAYVSLHRSEGFGRTLAEAMLFGKPVVGTNFSGNVDFLKYGLGFPVKWTRRLVKPGEYPFVTEADGAWWAEPDIADAARQLRAARCAAKDELFAVQVKAFAESQFSPAWIGQRMKERMVQLWDAPEVGAPHVCAPLTAGASSHSRSSGGCGQKPNLSGDVRRSTS
ncbi:MAG: glycosyltransferase [Rhodocyclales bacterium]|nr:glycosyltransferase [Rhodocyclales bacterium]